MSAGRDTAAGARAEDASAPTLEIGPLRPDEAAAVAKLHASFFTGEAHGHSIANLGEDFLEHVFYRLNLDNPYFFCDVARADGGVVGFSVYTTDRQRVFRRTVRAKFLPLAWQLVRLVVGRPKTVLSLLSNARYVGGESIPSDTGITGWWLVAGVLPEFRKAAFVDGQGRSFGAAMVASMEEVMRAHGCLAWYGAVQPWNKPINQLLRSHGALPVGSDRAQGLETLYYLKRLDVPEHR